MMEDLWMLFCGESGNSDTSGKPSDSLCYTQWLYRICELVLGHMDFGREVEEKAACLTIEKLVSGVVSGIHMAFGGFNHKPSRESSSKDAIAAIVRSCFLVCWQCLCFVHIQRRFR
ncbi:hypothetical protein OIU84_007777 [Salix udensis]|uniref:Uncharacterized protein n=1 Tax=Salix udensis TaxID=889485 RepID=A0AAD6NZS3_9ROSI|nr:hypothetical protein OIU84_007777 [Salix udensis]